MQLTQVVAWLRESQPSGTCHAGSTSVPAIAASLGCAQQCHLKTDTSDKLRQPCACPACARSAAPVLDPSRLLHPHSHVLGVGRGLAFQASPSKAGLCMLAAHQALQQAQDTATTGDLSAESEPQHVRAPALWWACRGIVGCTCDSQPSTAALGQCITAQAQHTGLGSLGWVWHRSGEQASSEKYRAKHLKPSLGICCCRRTAVLTDVPGCSASGLAASTTTWTMWARMCTTTPSSRCWATGPSGTTSRRRPSPMPGSS